VGRDGRTGGVCRYLAHVLCEYWFDRWECCTRRFSLFGYGFLGLLALVAADEPKNYEGGCGKEDGVYGDAYYAACWELFLGWLDKGVAAAEDCVGYDSHLRASCG